MFTCVGRRVALVESFRRAARRRRQPLRIIGADTSELSPAWQLCDQSTLVKPTDDPGYLRQLLALVRQYQIDLLIPTVDLDLGILASHKQQFSKWGCRVLVSDPDVVGICQDKRNTCRFLNRHGFDTPVTLSVKRMLAATPQHALGWPCFVKPWDGYASRYTALARNRDDLRFHARHFPRAICQEWIEGIEYTCDVYVDFSGTVRCVVPRQRLEVRAGEVSKARISKDARIMAVVKEVVTALGAGPGVITVQLIRTPDDRLVIIEINPRFGGGVPLSIEAGANFPGWLLAEQLGCKPRITMDGFQDGLTMLRYDSEVWVAGDLGG
jgi:carbamoyl-phosphate synthase large subunit